MLGLAACCGGSDWIHVRAGGVAGAAGARRRGKLGDEGSAVVAVTGADSLAFRRGTSRDENDTHISRFATPAPCRLATHLRHARLFVCHTPPFATHCTALPAPTLSNSVGLHYTCHASAKRGACLLATLYPLLLLAFSIGHGSVTHTFQTPVRRSYLLRKGAS